MWVSTSCKPTYNVPRHTGVGVVPVVGVAGVVDGVPAVAVVHVVVVVPVVGVVPVVAEVVICKGRIFHILALVIKHVNNSCSNVVL